MVQINLPEFYHYNLPQLLEFLNLQDEKEYNITLPKKTVTGIDKNFQVFWEYYNAAFIGQQLYQIASHFTYTVPCTKKIHYFSFQVTIHDSRQMADVLFYLVSGQAKARNRASIAEYNFEAAKLLEDAFNGKKDTAC